MKKNKFKKLILCFLSAFVLTNLIFTHYSNNNIYAGYKDGDDVHAERRAKYEKDIEKYEKQLEKLEEDYADGKISDSNYEKKRESIEKNIEKRQEGINDLDEVENSKGIFSTIIDEFLKWLLESLLNILLTINDTFLDLTNSVLFPENAIGIIGNIYSNLYSLSLSISLSLMVLMTLSKGFNTYILWRDGSPEEHPFEVIIRHLFAIAMALSFNELYLIATNIVNEILGKVSDVVSLSNAGNYNDIINDLTNKLGIVFIIVFLVLYIVQLIKAMFATISKGIELLILRLGFPLACVSAVTPHASTYHSVVSSFIKAFLSVIVMKILVGLSLGIMFNNPGVESFIWAIGTLFMVNKSSQLLNQFIVPQQGGGGGMLSSSINQAGGGLINKGLHKLLPGKK